MHTANETRRKERLLLLYAIEVAVPMTPQSRLRKNLCPRAERGPAPDFKQLTPLGPTPKSSSWQLLAGARHQA